MGPVLLTLAVVATLVVATLVALRILHERRVELVRRSLLGEPEAVARFDPSMVETLPDPARRYLLRALAPGTSLPTSVELRIRGSIRLSRDTDPLPMSSDEVLSPPRGYVWRATVRKAPLVVRGFDLLAGGEAEMRWWLSGVFPIVRVDGPELARSAAGRLLGESILVPSALLPTRGARLEAVDDSTVTVRWEAHGEEVFFTLDVDAEGRLTRVAIRRWNTDPANGPVGYLPFVIDGLAAERTFDGVTIPTRFRAGWRLGEPDEFPFFFAEITDADYR